MRAREYERPWVSPQSRSPTLDRGMALLALLVIGLIVFGLPLHCGWLVPPCSGCSRLPGHHAQYERNTWANINWARTYRN